MMLWGKCPVASLLVGWVPGAILLKNPRCICVGPGVGVGRVRDRVSFGGGLRAKDRSVRVPVLVLAFPSLVSFRFGRFGFRFRGRLRRVVEFLQLLLLSFFQVRSELLEVLLRLFHRLLVGGEFLWRGRER